MAKQKPTLADRQITVGGQTYTLRFSIRALACLQEHYGLESIDAVGHRLADTEKFGVEDLIAIVWAGLRTHHREVDKEQVLDMLDEVGVAGIEGVVGDAFAAASGEASKGGGDDGHPPKPGR